MKVQLRLQPHFYSVGSCLPLSFGTRSAEPFARNRLNIAPLDVARLLAVTPTPPAEFATRGEFLHEGFCCPSKDFRASVPASCGRRNGRTRSEEHTSELQSPVHLV